ncbi:hypothetical protein NP233_g1499 [Leucocoprinus birnbaumii]|uniref:Uncharacterized protein n=1 Tax=Leucocoprinus birnbaumii TaxID=56174 RepID=A0AAD5YUS9_9AGAR|nr:hypothetical protein NP233_g1499 [Leucocoprinus birnbaumii]
MAPGRFLHGEGEAWRGGVRTGPTSERPFVFQRVDENFSSSNDPNTMNKDVGTIVLRIKRVRIAEAATPNAIQQLPGTSGGRNGMRVGFGIEQPTYEQYPSTWKVEGYDNPGSNRPSTYVSFVFRYRTLDFLRAQGIIDDVLPSTSSLHRRQPQRRIASTPIPQNIPSPAANTFIGSAGASTDSVYINLGSRPINTADSRRAVSMQTSFQQEEGQYEVEPVNYPGEGMLIFPTRKTN